MRPNTTYPPPVAHSCEALVPLADIARQTGSPVGRPLDICRWLDIDTAAVVEDWAGEPCVPAHVARDVVGRVNGAVRERQAEKTAQTVAQHAEQLAADEARQAAARKAAMAAAEHAAKFGERRWDLVYAAVAHRVYYGQMEKAA